MNIAFYFKNFEPSTGLRDYASKRFDKLSKYMENSGNAEVVVTLLVEKTRQIADVIIDADAMHISAHERSDDMYSTIDMITDKLEAQLRKMREKMKDRRKTSGEVTMGVVSFTEAGKVHSIEESDKYNPKPMGVEEAAEQLDALEYEFLVFLNSETDRINVIYKRKNHDYGLIDPGVSL
jgi:putative sigma-54 modulation protein